MRLFVRSLPDFPAKLRFSSFAVTVEKACGSSLRGASLNRSLGTAFKLADALRWMALERYLPRWLRPVSGWGNPTSDAEFFLLVWERTDGRCGVAMPMVDGDLRGVLRGSEAGWSVTLPDFDPVPNRGCLLFAAMGEEPVLLIEWAVARIAERLGTFRCRREKVVPQWIEYLGWCTRDALYSDVSTDRMLEGVAAF